MHANDLLKYGHKFILDSLKGLDEDYYETSGVCGHWSVKDVIGHLGATEGFLVEVLHDVLQSDAPKPFMEIMMKVGPLAFNDIEYEKRKDHTFDQVMAEYESFLAQAGDLMGRVPLEKQRQSGLLTWYGAEYDLEDFIVYSFYGHKREHGAQISVFRDLVNAELN